MTTVLPVTARPRTALWRIVVLSLLAGLTACSGGGGGSSPTPTGTFTVGGSVSGLTGAGLVLRNNGGDNINISASGNFTFATPVTNGDTYNVSVLTQPTGQTCAVSMGAGTVSGANVTNVAVVCTVNTYSLGGTAAGLTGSVVSAALPCAIC